MYGILGPAFRRGHPGTIFKEVGLREHQTADLVITARGFVSAAVTSETLDPLAHFEEALGTVSLFKDVPGSPSRQDIMPDKCSPPNNPSSKPLTKLEENWRAGDQLLRRLCVRRAPEVCFVQLSLVAQELKPVVISHRDQATHAC